MEPRVVPYQAVPARPHLMTPPASQACGHPGSMRGVWHHQDRRRRGPRELTGIVDHSRGGSSHGPLIGPGPRKVWHRVQEPAGQARKRLACGSANRRLDPFQGQQERHRLASSKTQPACSMPFISSNSLATPQVRCAAASSKKRPDTAGAQAIPSTKSDFSCAPRATSSPHTKQERLRAAFTAEEAHISVEVAYHCAQQVRDVFHQATPAQGRHLAAHLVESLPTCPIPHIAHLGANPTHMEGRPLGLLRHSRSQQRTTPKPSTDTIELGKRTARGHRNPTNYQLRMLLTTGGLDASTHTQL